MRQIRAGELAIGMPLPWDVYGDGGGLLARKGYPIANDSQIASLIKRGQIADLPAQLLVEETPSVLRMLNRANARLELVLGEIAGARSVSARQHLGEIALQVMAAIDLHPDVALACILHNQACGPYAIRHSIDTAIVAAVVARAFKLTADEVITTVLAALTMNVGMLGQQERMQGSRAPLSEADTGMIRAHPQAGVALLRKAGITDSAWLDCVLMHHENENGSGYPSGVQGDAIAALAKIVALADRYCARVSARDYRKPMLPNVALRDLLIEGRSASDAQLTALFIRELGIYPIGTFVRLLNGEIGVVTRKGGSTTTPIVDALVGPRGAPLDVIIRRDTQNERHSIREVLNETQAAIGFNLDQLWGRVASA